MSHNGTICVIDDDSSIRWVLDKALTNAGLRVAGYDSADSALQAISKQEPAVIITDIACPAWMDWPCWSTSIADTRTCR